MTRHFLTFALCVATLLVALASVGFAQESLSLSEALDKAVANSPTLQKAQAQAEEGKWRQFEGVAEFLPNFSITGSTFFIQRYQLIDVTLQAPVEFPAIVPNSTLALNANWLIFDGLGNVDRYRRNSFLKDADSLNADWVKFQLEEEVKLAYSHVIAAKKLKDAADQNLLTLKNHLEQVIKLKSGGIATHYDVLRVEAQVSEAQAEALQTQDNIQIAQEHLGQVLGVADPAANPVDVKSGELETPNSAKIKSAQFRVDSSKRLDLRSLENRVSASDLTDQSSSKFWVPRLSLGGQYQMYNDLSLNLTDWNNYRPAWNAGLFLSWDIFTPMGFARSKEESFKSIQNQKSLQLATTQAPVDFAFWKKRYLYSATLYEAKIADLARADETLRLAQAGFKAGIRTTTEVLDAELDLFRARAGIVNSQMNCVEAKSKLELAIGEKL